MKKMRNEFSRSRRDRYFRTCQAIHFRTFSHCLPRPRRGRLAAAMGQTLGGGGMQHQKQLHPRGLGQSDRRLTQSASATPQRQHNTKSTLPSSSTGRQHWQASATGHRDTLTFSAGEVAGSRRALSFSDSRNNDLEDLQSFVDMASGRLHDGGSTDNRGGDCGEYDVGYKDWYEPPQPVHIDSRRSPVLSPSVSSGNSSSPTSDGTLHTNSSMSSSSSSLSPPPSANGVKNDSNSSGKRVVHGARLPKAKAKKHLYQKWKKAANAKDNRRVIWDSDDVNHDAEEYVKAEKLQRKRRRKQRKKVDKMEEEERRKWAATSTRMADEWQQAMRTMLNEDSQGPTDIRKYQVIFLICACASS